MAIDYEPLDMAEIQTESERVNSDPTQQSNDDFLEKFVRIPEGEGYVVMRFLPRKKGKKLYCATKTHRLKGSDGKSRSYHSPKELVMTERGPRWEGQSIIDKYLRDVWQRSEQATGEEKKNLQNQYRQIKGFDRYYYNVIVRQEKDKDGNIVKNAGPKIYSCGKTVHAMIMRAISGDKSAGLKPLGDITHPTNGRDFRLVKKITKGSDGDYPNYDLSQFEDPSPLGTPEEMEQWMDNLHDLEALRVVKTDEELKHALKVHLGLVKDEHPGAGADDYDPSEFQVPKTKTSASTAAEETVRDELTNSVTEEQVTEAKAEEEEVLADEDFMEELAGM